MIAKQERSRKRVKIILNTARDILAESSVDEITIANIAKRANLKRTSTYKFFPSPEKIKMMIIEDDLEQCAKDLALNCENNSSDNLKKPLEKIIIELIKLLKESLSLQKLVLASNITPPLTISSLDLLSSVIEDYIEKIIQTLNDVKLRDRIGNSGRKYVVENFSWESSNKELIKILSDKQSS